MMGSDHFKFEHLKGITRTAVPAAAALVPVSDRAKDPGHNLLMSGIFCLTPRKERS
jgi:hypothetical protein